MDVHRGLVERIEALRQRLRGLTDDPAAKGTPTARRLHELLDQFLQVEAINEDQGERLAALLRGELGSPAPERLPAQLAYRARRLLLRTRGLLDRLRDLAAGIPTTDHATEPTWQAHRQAVSMAELALRSVQSFPEGTAEQLRLCDGLEGMLDRVEERVRQVEALAAIRKTDDDRLQGLGATLLAIVQNRPFLHRTLTDLAEQLLQDAREGLPTRFLTPEPGQSELLAAAHGLNVAQVAARLGPGHDLGTHARLDAVLAALLHDAGMAAMPVSLLTQPAALDEGQRRQIEAHVGLGAEGVRRAFPRESWLSAAIMAHHERLDGTGYPSGLRGAEIPRLARVLALLDVYVGMQEERPHRPAQSPRAALTEALVEAERGQLDAELAECLLELSFYPVGSVVELSDGRLGLVVATQHVRRDHGRLGLDPAAPTKPVVRILTNPDGSATPLATHLNLAQAEGVHVVRALTAAEARRAPGIGFPAPFAA